jgi:hypothetical protein
MDGSVHIQKALGRASRLEPLHFTLSSPHDLVGVLGAIVLPQSLLMRASQVDVLGTAAPQIARDHGTEFQHPAPHCFVGHVETALGSSTSR